MITKKIKVILNCDTKNEIDDQFAITYAIKSKNIDLLGVVSVHNYAKHGPLSVDIYNREAQKIIRLNDKNIPALKGSRLPLKSKDQPEKSEGVDFIIKTAAISSREKIYIVCTGPCTDLASVLLLKPEINEKCIFVWLGGFRNKSEQRKLHGMEANFQADKIAAEVLFNSGAKIVHIPVWGVADSLVVNSFNLAQGLKKSNLPINRYLAELLDSNWHRFWAVKRFIPKILKKFWILTDVAAVAYVKDVGISEVKQNHGHRITKRKIFFDEKCENLTTIVAIDEHMILSDLKEVLFKD